MGWYDRKVRRVRDLSCGDTRIFLELEVRRVECRRCGTVKRERLDFLADNPLYTERFAYYVGRRCRSATIKDVAAELKLDWHTVKTLEQQYMEAQLKRAGTPSPRVIGIDEIAIRKGHSYRIVVSDLLRGRPIWFGGKDRAEASMSEFYAWLGKRKNSRIRLGSSASLTLVSVLHGSPDRYAGQHPWISGIRLVAQTGCSSAATFRMATRRKNSVQGRCVGWDRAHA